MTAFFQSAGTSATEMSGLYIKVKGVTNECLSLVKKRTGGKPSRPEQALAFILLMARKTSDSVTGLTLLNGFPFLV